MKTILRNTSLILLVVCGLAVLTGVLSVLCEERGIALVFALTSLVTGIPGAVIYIGFRKAEQTSLRIALSTAVIGWAAFSVAAAFPFAIAARFDLAPSAFLEIENCLFEGTSAATSTGLTVVPDTAALAKGLQFWRSLCQWIGGLGVLVLAISVFEFGEDYRMIYRAVARSKTLEDNVEKTAKSVWKVHLLLTGIVFLGYGFSGMAWWEALNHALTTVSTGGFTMNGEGVSAYETPIKLVMMLGMCAGAISFVSHYRAIFGRKIRAWISTSEHLAFLGVLIVGSLLTLGLESEGAMLDRLFLWVSGLTTSGFQPVAIAEISGLFVFVLILAMLAGGMVGSTTGGVKFARVVEVSGFFFRLFGRLLREALRKESSDYENAFESDIETDRRLRYAIVVVGLWILTAITGIGLLALLIRDSGYPISLVAFEAMSALGCVGLSAGIVSPELATAPKLLLCVLMWAGRIELIPMFVLGAMLLPLNWRERFDIGEASNG